MNVEFYFFSVSKIYILVVKFNPFLSLNLYHIVTGFQKMLIAHLCVVLAFVERLCGRRVGSCDD